jgi:hypothetical protein
MQKIHETAIGAQLVEKITTLEAENLRLRTALADCANHVGAVASPACTLEFLEIIPQEVRLVTERLRREHAHWRANHENLASRARFLSERTDLPVERIRAYQEMVALQAFHEFFDHRCEGLFAQFGMPAIDAYNAAAPAMKRV